MAEFTNAEANRMARVLYSVMLGDNFDHEMSFINEMLARVEEDYREDENG